MSSEPLGGDASPASRRRGRKGGLRRRCSNFCSAGWVEWDGGMRGSLTSAALVCKFHSRLVFIALRFIHGDCFTLTLCKIQSRKRGSATFSPGPTLLRAWEEILTSSAVKHSNTSEFFSNRLKFSYLNSFPHVCCSFFFSLFARLMFLIKPHGPKWEAAH